MQEPIYEQIDPLKAFPLWEQVMTYVLLAVFPLTGLLFAAFFLYVLYEGLTSVQPRFLDACFELLFFGGCTAFFLRLGWCVLSRALARFRFCREGLAVTFPFRRERLIPWEDFQQVCVCYTGYPHRDTTMKIPSDICFVRKGEKKNIYGRWKENNFHYSTVIYIPLRPEYLAALQAVCPYPVPDLRGIGNYRV